MSSRSRAMRSLSLPIVLWMTLAAAVTSESLVPYDYQVKAVYLFKFTRYIQWPGWTGSPDAPAVLCLIENDPFGSAMDAASRAWQGPWPVEVRHLQQSASFDGCHLVFIPEGHSDLRRGPLSGQPPPPILTVGESARFLKQGGMIRFVTEGNTVSFEVNLTAAEDAGLRISSRLLQVARTVDRQP